MQYLLMCCIDEQRWMALPAEERDGVMRDYGAWIQDVERERKHRATEKLMPSAAARTIRLRDGKSVVTDGPFAETKELVAGYWILQCKSLAEAVEWIKRCPNPHDEESEIEIRQMFELEDFGDSDAVEHHRRLGEDVARKK